MWRSEKLLNILYKSATLVTDPPRVPRDHLIITINWRADDTYVSLQLSVFTKNVDGTPITYAELLPHTNMEGEYVLRFVFELEDTSMFTVDFSRYDGPKTLSVSGKRCGIKGVLENPSNIGNAFTLSSLEVPFAIDEDIELNGHLAVSSRRTMGGRRPIT